MCGADVRKQRKGRDSSSTYQVGARLPVNKLLADIFVLVGFDLLMGDLLLSGRYQMFSY